MPDPVRACSSILLETDKSSYLIDAGEGCASSILRHKVDSDKIKQVFITHTHSDHSIGIFMLVQMLHLLGRRENLEIYLPEESVFWFENMFDALYLFPDNLSFRFELKPITRDFVFRDENLILKPYPNQHLYSNKELISEQGLPNKMESYCFLIEIDKKKIVYSGDIARLEDIEGLIEGVDYLLCESTHINLEELFALVSSKEVKLTILTHIYEEVEKKREFLLEKAGKLGCRNLQFASDGLKVDIP